MWGAFKCFFGFPFFSSALPVGDNKYLWTSDSISMLSQYYKWHHPNLRRVLKLIDCERKGNHRAVSTSLPCQTAAWCCRGVMAFSFDYQGLLERIEIVDVFCLGLNRMFFFLLYCEVAPCLPSWRFHFSLPVFPSVEWLPSLLPTSVSIHLTFSCYFLLGRSAEVPSLLESLLS